MEVKVKRKYVKKSDYWNKPRSESARKNHSRANILKHFKKQLDEAFERIDKNGKNEKCTT